MALSRGTPEEIHLGGEGRGRTYSPFIRWTDPACAKDIVLSKCSAVHAWWLSIEKDVAANRGAVHAVKGRAQREHRLIETATPSIQPSGYFDCTVEVSVVLGQEVSYSSPLDPLRISQHKRTEQCLCHGLHHSTRRRTGNSGMVPLGFVREGAQD